MPTESAAHLSHRSVAIIGGNVHQHGHPMRPIAFKSEVLQSPSLLQTRPSSDGPLDVVLGHIGLFGFLNDQP